METLELERTRPEDLPEILEPRHVAELLHLSQRQVADYTRAGILPHTKLSAKAYRYKKTDLLDLFKS